MAKADTYTEAVGRRKSATARVRITPAKQDKTTVNDRSLADYFMTETIANTAHEALKYANGKFNISVKTRGGGLKAQAEAVRHGLARALTKYDQELRKELKHAGFLKRDPRVKERKKFGLKKARRSPQWSKR